VTLRALRAALAVSTLLVSGVAAVAFLAAPEAGGLYARLVAPAGTALPVPTASVALPLLRVAPGGAPHEATTSTGAAAVWALLLLAPWAILAFALRASDVPSAVARWVSAWSVWLPVVAAMAAAVLVGLLLPFVPL
jgi:hypothetical protein